MKFSVQKIALLLLLFIFCKCKQRNKTIPVKNSVVNTIKLPPVLSISLAGEIGFRQSYNQGGPDWSEKEDEEMHKALPVVNEGNSFFNKQFQQFGFAKDNKLLLNHFKPDKSQSVEIKDQSGNRLTVKLELSPDSIDNKITVQSGTQSAGISFKNNLDRLSYKILDIIPGGYPEIVLLRKYYVIMGDNFDFSIYEIKNGL
ncbi:MAG: hypothetical protein ABI480_05825 [Chitinophagaceae bacterium]